MPRDLPVAYAYYEPLADLSITQYLAPQPHDHMCHDIVLADESGLRNTYGLESHARIYQQYAANHGDVNAQLKLAEEYYWGNNVPRDYPRVCFFHVKMGTMSFLGNGKNKILHS